MKNNCVLHTQDYGNNKQVIFLINSPQLRYMGVPRMIENEKILEGIGDPNIIM